MVLLLFPRAFFHCIHSGLRCAGRPVEYTQDSVFLSTGSWSKIQNLTIPALLLLCIIAWYSSGKISRIFWSKNMFLVQSMTLFAVNLSGAQFSIHRTTSLDSLIVIHLLLISSCLLLIIIIIIICIYMLLWFFQKIEICVIFFHYINCQNGLNIRKECLSYTL